MKLDRKHKALIQKVIFTGNAFYEGSTVPFNPNTWKLVVSGAQPRAIGGNEDHSVYFNFSRRINFDNYEVQLEKRMILRMMDLTM